MPRSCLLMCQRKTDAAFAGRCQHLPCPLKDGAKPGSASRAMQPWAVAHSKALLCICWSQTEVAGTRSKSLKEKRQQWQGDPTVPDGTSHSSVIIQVPLFSQSVWFVWSNTVMSLLNYRGDKNAKKWNVNDLTIHILALPGQKHEPINSQDQHARPSFEPEQGLSLVLSLSRSLTVSSDNTITSRSYHCRKNRTAGQHSY